MAAGPDGACAIFLQSALQIERCRAEHGTSPAWMYAHSFDTPGPSVAEDVRIPGIPVRSQVASPFDIRSGAFHGVRAVNGYSAVRAEMSIPCGDRRFVTGPGFNEVTGQAAGAPARAASPSMPDCKSSAQAVSDEYAFYFK